MTVSEITSAPTERRTAAQRVLAVLEVFDRQNVVLSLSEISRRAQLTLSTTHRLVGELMAWGGLVRTGDGRYAIGVRVLELGSLEPSGMELRDVAPPYLGDLHAATDANIHLAVRDHLDVVYIYNLRSRRGVQVPGRLGGRWPLRATATGRVLLAAAPQDLVDEVLGDGDAAPAARQEHAVQLWRGLADVRRAGFAVVEDTITPGVTAIAVPIRGERDRTVAALGITVASCDRAPHKLLTPLASTAQAISRALTAPPAIRRSSSA